MKTIFTLALTAIFALSLNAQDSTKVDIETQLRNSLETLEMKIDQLEWAEIQDKAELYINDNKPTKEDFEKFKAKSKETIAELRAKDYSSIRELEKGFEHTMEDLGEIVRGISSDFESLIEEMEVKKPGKTKEVKQI